MPARNQLLAIGIGAILLGVPALMLVVSNHSDRASAVAPGLDSIFARPLFESKGASPTAATPAGLTPAQVRHTYGLDSVGCTFSGTFGDANLCGSGQTIAIIDAYDAPSIESDLNVWFCLTSSCN